VLYDLLRVVRVRGKLRWLGGAADLIFWLAAERGAELELQVVLRCVFLPFVLYPCQKRTNCRGAPLFVL